MQQDLFGAPDAGRALQLRPYQRRAIDAIHAAWAEGHRRVLCVLPTGGGKGLLAREATRGRSALWLVHRIELADQTRQRVPEARCETIQGLLASGERPPCDVLVVDEAHHIVSDEWGKLLLAYPDIPCLGLTATPARDDGRPLGDAFDRLVVGAQYSELLAGGYLVPCDVWRPDTLLDPGELSHHPLDALARWGSGGQAFLFCRSVEDAYRFRQDARDRGVSLEVIEAGTRRDVRTAALDDFKAGRVQVLGNVYCLTEGVDVPAASVCIIARRPQHASTYLQQVGRVLRPAPGKDRATLIDLTGCSYAHGLPTDDREYSLSGRAIAVAGAQDATEVSEAEDRSPAPTTIYCAELRRVYAGANTPEPHRRAEWGRLVALCHRKDWGLAWAVKSYAKLFGSPPPPEWTADEDKRAEFRKLADRAAERGYKPGWAAYRYKAAFGRWPPRGWGR